MNTHGAKWYAVQTEPLREDDAALRLRRLPDVELFLPQHLLVVTHARRRRALLRPLLSGYLFARMGVPSFAAVRRQAGVRDLLGVPGLGPQPVADWQFVQFRRLFDQDGVLIPPHPQAIAAKYLPGTRAPLVDGPGAGIIAEVRRVDGPDKIRVLMHWFGRLVETQVPAWFLGEPVSPAIREASPAEKLSVGFHAENGR